MQKKRPTGRAHFGSTEGAARKVLQGIQATRPKSKKVATKKRRLDPTKPTARTPKGVQKSKAQGERERQALLKKQRERIAAAKKKQAAARKKK